MSNEIMKIESAEMLQAINRSEIDMQIATAKQYPRDIAKAINQIVTYGTMDEETAEDCFYALRRGGDTIEGVSVRLAEIMADVWGNLRVQTRIVGNDGRTITCQGVCHDLETNVAVCVEVKRRITDSKGNTYSEDMQVLTGMAASSIAFRNAVLKIVPKAVTKNAVMQIKEVALGKSMDLETSRKRIIDYYAKLGVAKQMLLDYLGIDDAAKIDKQMVYELRATANAIKEGTTTVRETFCNMSNVDSKKIADDARAKAESAMRLQPNKKA